MGHRIRGKVALLVALLVVVMTGCSNSMRVRKPGEKLNVLATYSILGDVVQNVAGDQVNLTVIVGAGNDAHTFEPSPQDTIKLANADMVFENGLEFEGWLDKLYRSSRSTARRIVVTKGLDLIAMAGHDDHKHDNKDHKHDHGHAHDHKHDHGHDHGHAHDHHHGEFDPHVWHDVKNVLHMVKVTRDALVDMDPANKEKYVANAAAYEKQLQELDDSILKQVEVLPKERRKLVTSHDTFSYFARRYGFVVVGTALGSVTTEASDPSAAQLAKLIESVKAAQVPAIFAENVANPRLMTRIAKEANVKLAPPLYTDALGEPGSKGDTYVGMMKYNVATIVSVLKP